MMGYWNWRLLIDSSDQQHTRGVNERHAVKHAAVPKRETGAATLDLNRGDVKKKQRGHIFQSTKRIWSKQNLFLNEIEGAD